MLKSTNGIQALFLGACSTNSSNDMMIRRSNAGTEAITYRGKYTGVEINDKIKSVRAGKKAQR